LVFWKNRVSADHQQRGDAGGVQILQAEHDAAGNQAVHDEHRVLGHAHVDAVDGAAEHHGPQAVEQVGNAQRGHQECDGLLVHQVAQGKALYHPGHQHHQGQRDHDGQQVAHHARRHAQPAGNPLGKARHGQGREQHHGALREVEDARGLEDQHEADGDQRVQRAHHQAADQGFEKKSHVLCSCWV